jgi:DUF4097 and DUF4098 domain-containing protein YvlB
MKILCATFVACALAAAPVEAEESINKKVAADPAGEVEVSNVAGIVSIAGWNRSEVEVTGTLGDDVERFEFESSGKRTIIKVHLKKSSHWGDSGETELSIRVPTGSSLDVNTVSADISVVDVTGEQRLQAVSGDISAEVAREAEIKSVSGDVSARGNGSSGVFTVTTVSGDAQVQRIAGEITASTVSGDLELALDKLTRARARSTSGEVRLSGTSTPEARIDAETISGGLTVDIKGRLDAQVEIESFSGEIRTCTGHPVEHSEHVGSSELRFSQGSGAGRVMLKTLSGEIDFCAR